MIAVKMVFARNGWRAMERNQCDGENQQESGGSKQTKLMHNGVLLTLPQTTHSIALYV